MATKTSSKYDHITSKVLIPESGSPAVYQLKPKRENIGTLTKMTLGEKNPNKPNKTILLVGGTGTGKSTLINALVNYAMGVKWEDDVWFKIIEDEERRQTESQTSDVIVYQIFGFEGKTLPYSLTIIDTPGYGDTRGTEKDDIIGERLLDWFRSDDGVHEINAVGLVLKASVNRLDDRLSYIFDSLMSLFGKDMEEKIVALITHSNGRKPKDALEALKAANIKFAKDEKNQPVYFLFDNCQTDDRTEDPEELKNIEGKTKAGLSKFTNFLDKTAPQKLETMVHVLNERLELKACIQNLKERVEFIEYKQKEIQQIKYALREHEEEMKNNENFIIEVDEVSRGKQNIDSGGIFFYTGATCCLICEENCHYPGCTVAWIPQDCEVMKNGRCTSCTGKCRASKHVKEDWIYVSKTRKVKKTLKDVKEKYEKNKAGCVSKLNILEELEKEMEELQKKKDQLLDESFQHVVRLEQIALNVDSVSIHVHLDFLIEKMEEKGDGEKVEKLEEIKSRLDKDNRLKAAFQYGLGRIAAAGKAVGKAVGINKN